MNVAQYLVYTQYYIKRISFNKIYNQNPCDSIVYAFISFEEGEGKDFINDYLHAKKKYPTGFFGTKYDDFFKHIPNELWTMIYVIKDMGCSCTYKELKDHFAQHKNILSDLYADKSAV